MMVLLYAVQESAESLLRSALQGKGYTKGIQLQNCIAIIPGNPQTMKNDAVVRQLLNGDNQVSNHIRCDDQPINQNETKE